MNDLISQKDATTRMERYQTFQAGEYWRALDAIPDQGIAKGEVLLIQSIKDVDGRAHEVHLRAHPSKIGRRQEIEDTNANGKTVKRLVSFEVHRFLVRDFLLKFEFAVDSAEVRARELLAAQKNIEEKKEALLEAQRDPSVVDAHVADVLSKREGDGSAPDAGASGVPAQLFPAPAPTLGTAIANGIDERGIEQLKVNAQHQKDVAEIQQNFIQTLSSDVAAAVTAMTPYYTEQAAAAMASTEDTRRYVNRLMDGIANLDLYVGKDVDITTVVKGRSAPASLPLTLVQKRLYVDEEAAVFLEIDEWFDFRNVDKFLDLLRANTAFVEQLFPTERCIVLMAIRRTGIDYGHVLVNHQNNQINQSTFLMVRDGENIHKVHSPVESHLRSNHLFPSKDEFGKNFRGMSGEELTLDDLGYSAAHDDQKRFELHYKRFLILLCGLDHNHKLFGPFYEGDPSFKFVSTAFQEQYFNFIHDLDGEGMLPANIIEPVGQWADKMNAYLRPGSRLIARWADLMDIHTAPGAVHEDYRGKAEFRYYPNKAISVLVVQKDKDGLFVKVPVSGYTVASYESRSFECRVGLHDWKLDQLSSLRGIGWLCLDMVRANELETYLHHRPSRTDYIEYIELVKTSLRYLQSCEEEEQETRAWLLDAALTAGLVGADGARGLIQTTVSVWRCHHKGNDLPSRADSSIRTSVWNNLLNLMHMIAKGNEDDVRRVEQFANELGYEPLRFSVTGNGQLRLYCAPLREEQDNRFLDHEHVHLLKIKFGKTKVRLMSQKWEVLAEHHAAEHVLHEWAGAVTWQRDDVFFANPAQKALVLDRLSQWKTHAQRLLNPDRDQWTAIAQEWLDIRTDISTGKYVEAPSCYIPFALVHLPYDSKSVFAVSLYSPDVFRSLYHCAPSEQEKEIFERSYIKPYAHAQRRRIDLIEGRQKSSWEIAVTKLDETFYADDWSIFGGNYQEHHVSALSTSSLKPLLNDAWSRWVQSSKDVNSVWVAGNEDPDLDATVGNALPEDYHPCSVCWISLGNTETFVKEKKVALFFDTTASIGGRPLSDTYEGRFISCTQQSYATKAEAILDLTRRGYVSAGPKELSDGTSAPEWIKSASED